MAETSPEPTLKGTKSNVALGGHPLHPMLVTFPIALLLGVLASDLAFLYDKDPFWARMSLWLVGSGTFMGIVAGLAGTIELLSVAGIRRRAPAWNHFIVSVMLLAVGFANWMWRLGDPGPAVLPWGLYLSGLGALLVVFAGWLGGALVFEHQIGIEQEEED